MLNRNSKGFTLIELLIVVAIIGIIAAIAIPNLLNAIDRGKQKRTMADLRSMGTSIEEYSIDNNFYPDATDVASLEDQDPDAVREPEALIDGLRRLRHPVDESDLAHGAVVVPWTGRRTGDNAEVGVEDRPVGRDAQAVRRAGRCVRQPGHG